MFYKHSEEWKSTLTPEAVDEVSDRVRTFLIGKKIPSRDALRYALTAEEILLKYLEQGYENAAIQLTFGTRLQRNCVILHVGGQALNVFADREEEQGALGDGLLKSIGLSPDYAYSGSHNAYTFAVKKKSVNPLLPFLLSILCALAVGALGFLLPSEPRTALLDQLITPLNDTFLNILGCIAGPMIFLSVSWGIYGIGNAATLKQIGSKLCVRFIAVVTLEVVAICALALPFFTLNFAEKAAAGSDNSALSLILDIVPKNIFSPFVDGNTLQIIFLAIAGGIAMLFLGQKTDFVAQVVEQINMIVQFLIEAISKVVPFFIFLVLVKLMWSDTLGQLTGIGQLILLIISAIILASLITVAVTSIRNRISPFLLIKKGFSTLIIAVTTASSAAAFGSNMNACRDKYGIDDSFSSFGLPLGIVMHKPSTAINYLLQSLFFAELFRVDISFGWLCRLVLIVIILSIASPPIPGGGLAAYAVLFTQMGIPMDGLAIALACETLLDFLVTGLDQFGIPLILLNQAKSLNMTDEKTLRKR